MYLTLDDYIKIEQWLNKRGIKDTEFPDADTLDNKDYIPVIQDDRNKKLSVVAFTRFLETMTGNLINVSSVFNKYGITLNEAINTIPPKSRRLGLIITFLNEDNEWVMYQFNSDTLNDWLNENKWSLTYENACKFKGLFSNEEALKDKVKKPLPGDYAFVGETMEEAELWICEDKGIWKNTLTRAHRYADLFEAIHSKDFGELEYTIEEQYCDRAEKDALGNIIHFTYITREGFSEYVLDKILNTITKVTLPEGSIGLEQLSDSLKDYISSGGQISNYPDEEDLTSKRKGSSRVLSFKDKQYNPLDFSGKGRKYLRKNMADGINVLEQHMFDSPNTIYIIQYDYCLNGAVIEIPENCILRFEGGSFNGGTVVLNNTKIEGESYDINVDVDVVQKSRSVSHIVNNTTFINITFEGTYAVGQQLFHKDLRIPIWWNGESWITQDWMSIDIIEELINSKVDKTEFDSTVENIEGLVQAVSVKVDDNINSIDSLNNDVTTITENLNDLTEKHDKYESDINDAIDLLDKEITSKGTDLIAAQKDITTIKKDIVDINNAIDTIDSERTADGIEIKNIKKELDTINTAIDVHDIELNGKVNKVEGKGLSTNDFTNEYKSKIDNMLSETDIEGKVNSGVNAISETVSDIQTNTYTKTEINNKLANKVDIVEGKQLSTEDFTTLLKQKLEQLAVDVPDIDTRLTQLQTTLNTLIDDGGIDAVINSFIEVQNFLAGITNQQTLAGMLLDLRNDIVALCADTYLPLSGGTISNSNFGKQLEIKRTLGQAASVIRYTNNTKPLGYIGFHELGYPFVSIIDSVDSDGNESRTSSKLLTDNNYSSTIFNGTSSQFLKADGSVDSTNYYNHDTFTNKVLSGGGVKTLQIRKSDGSIVGRFGVYFEDDVPKYNVIGWGDTYEYANSVVVGEDRFLYKNNKVWHAGNDGSGSGLDADLLDGKQPADLNVGSADKLTTKQLTNEDLNTITNGGAFYYATGTNSCTNVPFTGIGFSLQVNNAGLSGTVIQILTRGTDASIFTRRFTNNNWSNWQQLATTYGAVAKLTTKQLTNEDLNDIKDANFSTYWANSSNTCTNKPDGISEFYLQAFRISQTKYCQVLTNNIGVTYKRIHDSTKWLSWKKMLTEDDIASLVSRIEALEAKHVVLTQAEYDALTTKDSNKIYMIKEE